MEFPPSIGISSPVPHGFLGMGLPEETMVPCKPSHVPTKGLNRTLAPRNHMNNVSSCQMLVEGDGSPLGGNTSRQPCEPHRFSFSHLYFSRCPHWQLPLSPRREPNPRVGRGTQPCLCPFPVMESRKHWRLLARPHQDYRLSIPNLQRPCP